VAACARERREIIIERELAEASTRICRARCPA
jgi:hypothetical protein